MLRLIKGLPDHPSHPPLTDASIGTYTVGALMLVLGALGVETSAMARGGLIAISFGLVLAAPTALTGLLDWLDLPKGSAARATATIHLFTMIAATVVFAGAWLLQRPGYDHGVVKPGGWIAAAAAEILLAVGGYVGGTIVFVHGHRVVGDRDLATSQALRPGGVHDDGEARGSGFAG